jgi:hypothetical protein
MLLIPIGKKQRAMGRLTRTLFEADIDVNGGSRSKKNLLEILVVLGRKFCDMMM